MKAVLNNDFGNEAAHMISEHTKELQAKVSPPPDGLILFRRERPRVSKGLRIPAPTKCVLRTPRLLLLSSNRLKKISK